MPLNQSCSVEAYRENIRTEIRAGKEPEQAAAIARRTLEDACSREGKPVPEAKLRFSKKDKSFEYLQAALEQAKKLLPGWMYAVIHRAALPSSGGRAARNRRLSAAEKLWLEKSYKSMSNSELNSIFYKLNRAFKAAQRQQKDTKSIVQRAKEVYDECRRRKMSVDGDLLSELEKGFATGLVDGGMHAHGLDRGNRKTALDGSHCHLFVTPGLGDHLRTVEDGAHAHVIASDKMSTEEDGAHSHVVLLPSGQLLETELAGAHAHGLMVETSGFDGPHQHFLRLPDGTRLRSLSVKEHVETFAMEAQISTVMPPASTLTRALDELRRFEMMQAVGEEKLVGLEEALVSYAKTGEKPKMPTTAWEVRELADGGALVALADPEVVRLAQNVKGLDLQDGDVVELDAEGSIIAFSQKAEPDSLARAEAIDAYCDELVKSTESVGFAGPQGARLLFVSGHPSTLELARKEALIGPDGECFVEQYLAPLGLSKSEVAVGFAIPVSCEEPTPETIELWRDQLLKAIALYSRSKVVALGKTAKEALGPLAALALPHPAAVRRHKDSGEVGRKLKAFAKTLDSSLKPREDNDTLASIPMQGTSKRTLADAIRELRKGGSFRVPVAKALEEKRIVYGVILDPYQVDLQNDWIPPAEIESTAHDFLEKSRVVGFQHVSKAEASVVESWVEIYPSSKDRELALQNLPHKAFRRQFGADVIHSGAWVAGVKLSEELWELHKKGELDAFSIGGFSFKNKVSEDAMPEVQFVDLQPTE